MIPGNLPKKFWKNLYAQDASKSSPLDDEFWNDITSLLPIQPPRVDAYWSGSNQLHVVMELPGLQSLDQIQVRLHTQYVRLSGEIAPGYQVNEEDYLLAERFTGKFERKIAMPAGSIPEKTNAYYNNGLLYIEIRTKEEQPRKVEIKQGQDQGEEVQQDGG